MEEVDNLKQQRTKSKQSVTISARRITSSIQRGTDIDILRNLMTELEKAYSDFLDIDEEYANFVTENNWDEHSTVNGENLIQYKLSVTGVYETVREKYRAYINPPQTTSDNSSGATTTYNFPTYAMTPPSLNMATNTAWSTDRPQVSPIIYGPPVPTYYPSSELPTTNIHPTTGAYTYHNHSTPQTGVFTTQPVASTHTYPHLFNSVMATPTPVLTPQPERQSFGEIKLKKTSLPIFSGERKDWPEFKAVWRELAENAIDSKTALAHELKRSVRGEAAQRIKSVYATRPESYSLMWHKLESYYDDTTASVQAALENLSKLKPVKEDNFKGIIALVDEVEATYSQLQELGQLNVLTMRDVDQIASLLPGNLKFAWIRIYHNLSPTDKIRPFASFMHYLEGEREAVTRLADMQIDKEMQIETNRSKPKTRFTFTHQTNTDCESRDKQTYKRKFHKCAFPSHRRDTVQHTTTDCNEFKKLPTSKRYEMLKQVNACFICFGDHLKEKCPNKTICPKCNQTDHHQLLCQAKTNKTLDIASNHSKTSPVTSCSQLSLYPIQQAVIPGTGKTATLFCDGGSNTTYITHAAADRFHAKKLNRFTLDVTTMGNVQKTYDTWQYEVCLLTQNGKRMNISAFGMDRITGPVSKLDIKALKNLFPDYDANLLQRQSNTVDILLGCDYFGLHPKQEIARAGDNLSIMRGDFGVCIQGTHPSLKEETQVDSNLVKTIHDSFLKVETFHGKGLITHREFQFPSQCPMESKSESPIIDDCVSSVPSTLCDNEMESLSLNSETKQCEVNSARLDSKCRQQEIQNFIKGEELSTETTPRCGGCRCGKCPTVGHTYSFKEEQELKMIQENLSYDENKQCWITSYPCTVDPSSLPDNYSSALGTLYSTERTLQKDPQWADTYKAQIQDMLDRGVARKLTDKELKEWTGPKFYISHLAVLNPRSHSTPVRIVFNSSQVCQGVSLNACLAKGPDCYLNNLLSLLLRWREQPIALVGDIRKMFNSVHIKPLEQHCHRFLWRDLDKNRAPDVYVMERVNMGDTPAPAISSEAIYKTADKFYDDSPETAIFLKKSSYVDDLIDSFPSKSHAEEIALFSENMLNKGGFRIKCWQFSGEPTTRTSGLQKSTETKDTPVKMLLKGTRDNLRVLGLGWQPVDDVMIFQVTLNFSIKKKGNRTGPNLTETDIPSSIPDILTRRIVLEQVMMIYDPLGLVCPFTLLAKVYLRETWALRVDWDDQLPQDLRLKWTSFFKTMFEHENLKLPRCLKPAEVIGKPWLIILSDGSNQAYGFAAYILWTLKSGQHWCRLIMAKCRIAPLNRVSTPQMELNGAVLSKRARVVIQKEMRFDFERILHLVDSETVLNMVNKTSTRFKVYEGVRIGEIQAATNGDMSCWGWISGEQNVADWLTRGRTPSQLDVHSEWWNGPNILYRPVEQWELKFGSQRDAILPGEKQPCSTSSTSTKVSLFDFARFSSMQKLVWVVARVKNIFKLKSFKGGRSSLISSEILKDAENHIILEAQTSMTEDLEKTNGRYRKLNPVKSPDGIWIVGHRMQRFNAMTADSSLQKLVPTTHPVTRLLMKRAHEIGHRGRNATLAMFRQHYWTPHGDKVAKFVKSKCQMCKLKDPILLQQEMGILPDSRLKPSPPFNNVMLDLFGPYSVRGEVQKRTSGKVYGVIFTDLSMRAVHIETVCGYDVSSFLLALTRFTSLRGWPEVIYSDPGSQLVGAERELKLAWEKTDKNVIHRKSSENGLTWIFGPADSPWHQGAVESLIKSAKRAIHFAVGTQRLTPLEFQTVCTEVANLLNERPIGTVPSDESEINIFTPNSLLLGRATSKNPGGWQPQHSLQDRFQMVQTTTNQFWKKWTELYAPTLIIRQKWATSQRNLKPGDVVIVADRNTLRGHYRLGLVKEVKPSKDGKVRQVTLSYKNYKVGEKACVYSGAKDTVVTRSVQRLALLVPVDED